MIDIPSGRVVELIEKTATHYFALLFFTIALRHF